MSTTEPELNEPEEQDESTEIGQNGCCVPESEMLVILDRNLEVPWKGGNKYARVCPECRSRTFCPASYWEARNDDPAGVAYVVEKGDGAGENSNAIIRPLYRCPYTVEFVDDNPCGEEFTGNPLGEDPPESCPHCDRELTFGKTEE